MDHRARDHDAAVHRCGPRARVQDALLERRRGGPDSGGRHRHRGVHDLPEQPAHAPAAAGDVHRQRDCRSDLGPDPRHLQGQVGHQRDAVHADDELRGHPAHLLHGGAVGEPLRLQQRGRDQPEHPGGLVPEDLRPDLHAQRDSGHGAHRRHVLLPQAQQAGL